MPTKRVKMLNALKFGLLPLVELFYEMAASEVQSTTFSRRTCQTSVQKMVDNRNGRREAFDILKTMNIEAIEACILNTIGIRLTLDASLETNFYDKSNTCGIYVTTICLRHH